MKWAQDGLKHHRRKLHPSISLNKTKIAHTRLQKPQLIKNTTKAIYPVVCKTATNPVKKRRLMKFNDQKVDKMKVVRLFVNTIKDPQHPFIGKTKKWLVDQVHQQLSGLQTNTGIEFDVGLFDKIRKQTFMYSEDDVIKKDHKVRLMILFDSEEDAMVGYMMLKKAISPDLPWKVCTSNIQAEKVYCESDILSMIAQWLCGLELDKVT